VTAALCHEIAQAGPYGAGNPEPILALPSHRLVYAEEVGQAHVRARLRADDGATVDAIAFRAAGQALGRALADHRGRSVHVACCVAIDRWQGAERVQLRLVDLASAEPTALR
jgi:single-stranded-DNA-specific exonuclease